MGEAKPVQTGGASHLRDPHPGPFPRHLFPWKRTSVPPSPSCLLCSSSLLAAPHRSLSSQNHTSPYAPIRAPSVPLAPSPQDPDPQDPAHPAPTSVYRARPAPFLPPFIPALLFQPKMKTLPHADWLSGGWKQALTNQQAPARPAASRSRFRPDLETNKRAGGARGSGGSCLFSAASDWSHSWAGNPRGHCHNASSEPHSEALPGSGSPGRCTDTPRTACLSPSHTQLGTCTPFSSGPLM